VIALIKAKRDYQGDLSMKNEETTAFRENVLKNQQTLASNVADEYDFIVCGAGSSGSVVAGRLASDPNVRVLVLEAGGSDESEVVTDPNRWWMTLGTDLDWKFTAEPNPKLNGRAIPYSMGKVLGGGSSINVATWSRGHRVDWDFYAEEAGDKAWGYNAVLKLYREKIESWTGASDPQYRGTKGTVHVQPAADLVPFSFAVLDAAESVGLPRFPNANGQMMEEGAGCAFVDETVSEGQRKSIYRSYLYPVMNQPNVTVLTGALATKVLFEGKKAVGMEFLYNGQLHQARAAQEVILSAGAIQTPKLLMQSGIGDPEELNRFGIPVVQALRGVGRNLHDHIAFGALWEVAGDPPAPVPRGKTACFWKSDPALEAPNFYAYSRRGASLSAENVKRFGAPPADIWSLVIGMRPASRGSIHLTGANASDPVRVNAAYLENPEDLKSLVAGLKTARAIGNAPALAGFRGQESLPGNLSGSDLEEFFRNDLTTFWHQSCTAKMGRDEMSVVDSKLKVYGLDRLRVADASILPRVTTGNTMAPCVVIGERAAMLLGAA
jgi:choline dehydrogenase